MNHSAADLIERLESTLVGLGTDLAVLSASAGLSASTTARILRLDYDPPIGEVMTLARCAGMAVAVVPSSFSVSEENGTVRARGAETFAAQDLLRFRDVFRGYRHAIGVSPTRLAQLCDVNEKAFRRTEGATRSPSLGLACDCAEPLGLTIALVPESQLPAVATAVEADRKRRAPRLASELERSLPPPTDLPDAVQALAAILTDIADHHDLGVRQIAAATGIELATLTGERRRTGPRALRLNAIGSLPTTVRVAAFLGCELIIVPTGATDEVAQLVTQFPPRPRAPDARALDRSVELQLSTMQAAIERARSDLARAAASASDVRQLDRIGSSLRHAHTARLSARLIELGFTLMAVSSEMSAKARRIAERARWSPRKDMRKEDRETTETRNRRLTERFIVRLENACRHHRRGTTDLPQTRTPLQVVLERLKEFDLALDLIDVATRETVLRYRGRDAGELVGHIVGLRIKRGFSLHSLGAGVQLTHAAVRRAERPEARRKALLSSVLRYAETIGLDLVPSRP
ncbi:DNA-binding XRE family transcriptional regulator/lambda repressor-like predicted transcriptional regulator [Bradyrhizobium sp. USDA 4341]